MNFLPGWRRLGLLALTAGALCLSSTPLGALADPATASEPWVQAMDEIHQTLGAGQISPEALQAATRRMRERFPVQWDWTLQDTGGEFWSVLSRTTGAEFGKHVIGQVLRDLGEQAEAARKRLEELNAASGQMETQAYLRLYYDACEQRRALRLKALLDRAPRLVFVKQRTVQPSFFAYTEGQSDAQNERHFLPGSELCLLEFDGLYGRVRSLVKDPTGAMRDPAVSWDGTRILFAWKKALDDDDYHLYEYRADDGRVRQLTFGAGVADYEPAWLPDGEIIFSSTRCVQTVDCWWTEVSNLYRCDAEGRNVRRVTFDQVHSIFPQVMDDGRVIYTRWDYNDRGQIFPQPLFQMFADGTGQTEFYGNNSWFPTTIAHARGIPGTQKALAILCGHHSAQVGKLAVIDPAKGRHENAGVQLVAPSRETPAERIDSYGQEGDLWQYPYPIAEGECVTAYAPFGWSRRGPHGGPDFGIYWMDFKGRRELLARDETIPCTQPVPAMPRRAPAAWPTRVSENHEPGTYYLHDVYAGTGLSGVTRGTVRKLRVVALEFRAAGVGNNGSAGPGGAALVSTPIAIGNGSWDVKRVLGEATVHEDGSALFKVPPQTPVYFQALDERGYAVQTMRSWSTLQPGEYSSCVGCHEHKNSAPPAHYAQVSQAFAAGPDDLAVTAHQSQGFSFRREVQPILDRHCIRCHDNRQPLQAVLKGAEPRLLLPREDEQTAKELLAQKRVFSLLSEGNRDELAKRVWSDSYLVLTQARQDPGYESRGSWIGTADGRVVNWISSQSVPEPLPARSAGAARSGLMRLLEAGHQGVQLDERERRTIACWIDLLVPYCGDYFEANLWSDEEVAKYRRYAAKRAAFAGQGGRSEHMQLNPE